MAADEKKFGKYELVRTLGVGGMAQTFMARRFFQIGNEQVARPVCLKQILATYNTDEDFLIRFHLEAKLAIQLQHPNVVKVQDFGDVDGVHFMELELVDGVDLLGLLESQGGRLPVEIVKQIGLDIGAALQYAHNHVPQDTTGNMTPGRRGIIHRDISPSNILISQRGDIKLADFGIAKALSASATAKASRAPLGKLPYMAPERFNRKIPTDGRADLFSLGIVMFECVGGLRPYDGEDDSETIGNIIAGAPRSLSEEAPDMDEALGHVIEKLIAPNLDDRTPDAETLIEQLHEIAPPPRTRRELAQMVKAAVKKRESRGPAPATEQLPVVSASPSASASPGSAPNPSPSPVRPATPASSPFPSPARPRTPGPVSPVSAYPSDSGSTGPVAQVWTKRALIGALAALFVGLLAYVIVKAIEPADPAGPIVENPGPQTNTEGDDVELQINAKNPDHEEGELAFVSRGLPKGLSIDSTGLITGTIGRDAAPTYRTVVAVDNGSLVSTVRFKWTIDPKPEPPPPVEPPDDPGTGDTGDTGDAPDTGDTGDTGAGDTGDTDDPPARAYGYVKVVVLPWGTAWVNGRPYRAGPNGYMRLRTGRAHVIRAGQGDLSDASKRRRVRIGEGERLVITLDLRR